MTTNRLESSIEDKDSARLGRERDLLRAHGYVLLENAVADATIDAVADDLEPYFAATPRCHGDFYGWNTTRFGSLLLKSPSAQQLVLNRHVLGLVEGVLGTHCDRFQLNLSQAVRIHPGERQQVPHRDEEMWPVAKGRMEYLVNVLWALDDFTQENGATRIWPRSHLEPLDRRVDPKLGVIAEMPRGSALVFLGSLTHCGGANLSTAARTGVIFSYCLGWLRQYENQYLAYPPEIARAFPEELQALIGYRIHRPNLGGYEGQEPSVLLEGAGEALPALDALPESTAADIAAYYRVQAR